MAPRPLPAPDRRRPLLAASLYYLLTLAPFAVTGALLRGVEAWSGADLPILSVLLAWLLLRQLNVFILTALYHRGASHGAVVFHPAAEVVLRLWGWLFLGAGMRTWAAVHRWHHATTDTPDDPHSPTKPGGSWRNIGAQSIGSFWRAARHPELVARYTAGLPDDRLERLFQSEERRFFGVFGLRLPLLLGLLTSTLQLTLGCGWSVALAATFASLPATSGAVLSSSVLLINGLAHLIGTRRFETADTSTNLVRWDVLGMGEALHHNHHARPGAANMAMHADERDAGYMVLRALHRAGIVTTLRGA